MYFNTLSPKHYVYYNFFYQHTEDTLLMNIPAKLQNIHIVFVSAWLRYFLDIFDGITVIFVKPKVNIEIFLIMNVCDGMLLI